MKRGVLVQAIGTVTAGLLMLAGCGGKNASSKPSGQNPQIATQQNAMGQASGGDKKALPAGWSTVKAQGLNNAFITRVDFHDGQFYLYGTNNAIFTSTDGVNWQNRYANGTTHNNEVKDVAYTDKGIFAVTRDVDHGDDKALILHSDNGVDWTIIDETKGISAGHIAYGNGVLLSDSRRSFDGVHWEDWSSDIDGSMRYVAFGNGTFVGYGGALAISSDGKKWTQLTNDFVKMVGAKDMQGNISDMVYGNGTFVAYTSPSYRDKDFLLIATSTDGKTWSAITPTFHALNTLQFVNGRFLGTASEGKIVESQDGKQWKEVATLPSTADNYLSVTEGNGIMLAIDPVGTVFIKK